MPRSAPAPSSRRGLVVLLLVTALIAVSAAVCQVWTRLRAIRYGYRISEATRQQARLLEANRRLRLEVAVLTNPQRIAKEAEGLGLGHPSPEQTRRLRWGDAPRPLPTKSSTPGAPP